ncbi:MAG: hypothetical protein J0L52_09920 [Caulobacterales bacterium]|nr:hypothetical protein [Caulobacterales bacterium]
MGMPVEVKATCPVDGTHFTYVSTSSYSIFGRALDGWPRGSWMFPLALPECPQCRIAAVFGALTPEEARRARTLVESEAWRVAADDTSYWRLNLAEAALGRTNAWTRVDRLLSATWQTYGDRARYARYVRALSEALDADSDPLRAENAEAWAVFQTFVANAERQAGDFKGAAARLDRLEATGLRPEGVPELIARTRQLIADGNRQRADLDRHD